MAVTIKQVEAAPAEYPDPPDNLSAAAAALDPVMVWQRLEAYTAHRWTERAVVWIVEGCGEWLPPLSPTIITAFEIWSAGEWSDATVSAGPLGYCLPAAGPYRVTTIVGGGSPPPEVPASVLEAYRRLAEYMAAKPGKAGATSEVIAAGSIRLEHRRSASWMAMAVQNSGAGDLLRPYRRVA